MIFRELQKTDFQNYLFLINNFRNVGVYVEKYKFEQIYDKIFQIGKIFVCELDNKLVASVTVIIEQKFIHKLSKYAHIEDVIVLPEYRGKKIGEKIIEYVVNYCKNEKVYKMVLNCDDKLFKFYNKNNFIKNGISMSCML
tara:strand:+ start:486 stop:905 length:420 start_codon:yes stop_codon:yes gene_type:complete